MCRAAVAILAASLLAGASAPACADTFNFSYTVVGGVTATGTLTATLQSGNTYLITGITGTRNGSPILGLLAPQTGAWGNDNQLYFPSGGNNPDGNGYVDASGFLYSTAEGRFAPWFSDPSYGEEFGAPTGYSTITSFSVTQQSSSPGPIPGAGGLSYLILLAGGGWRWRSTVRAGAVSLLRRFDAVAVSWPLRARSRPT
jgi:hypothetical protein